MSDIIQQAADVMKRCQQTNWGRAAALAAAGLLVTPEQRAVLDAAEAIVDLYERTGGFRDPRLHAAVDALRAATPKDGE